MAFLRENALHYAHQWAFDRNPAYFAYDHVGGDCTNFISQCLLAGGMQMDDTPTFGWYYRSANDKAPAWTGVEYLWRYLTKNNRNLCGIECMLSDLQLADLVQLSFDGIRYTHCLMVVGTGREVLLCGHDEDSDFRPLSSYEYQKLRCLHLIEPSISAV